MCEKCDHIKVTFKIENPSDFDEAIEVVRQNLNNQILKLSTYWPKGKAVIEMPPFETEDWGDYVLYYFECNNCNQLFKLSVERYHGGGGCWQPENREDMG